MRERGPKSWRDEAALLGAVAIHAALLLFVARVARPPVPSRGADSIADALDVDLVPFALDAPSAEVPGEPAPAALDDGAPAAPSRAFAAASRVATPRPETPDSALALGGEDSGASPPVATASDAPAGNAPARPIDLGLGADGWKRWLGSDGQSVTPHAEVAPATPVVRAPPVSSTGGLAEGLAEADRERLVGPSGPVVNALESAAHGEGAAAFGVARFAVTVLRSGGVEVRLESASEGDAEWKRVAERAARSLRANVPPIHPPSEGARFVVDLSAEMRMPDGRRVAELYGPRVEPVAPRIHTWQAGEKDMALRNPLAASGQFQTDHMRANVELPGVYLAQHGKVCSYRIGLSLLGPMLQGGCEPSNIGAKAQRVVHAHVTGSELF
jgi:hypothetical protein